jgi:two-component system, chemotaxis family, sensor kinase CheA
MAPKNDDFLKRLLATFRVEADEHLKAMAAGLMAIENAPAGEPQTGVIEQVFREAHSLKGAARAVNLAEIESVCQALESVFSALKGGGLDLAPSLFDLLHEALDALGGLLGADGSPKPPLVALVRRLDEAARSRPTAPQAADAVHEPPLPAPVPPDRPAGTHALPMTQGLAPGTVRIPTAKLDAVMHQVEELLAPRLAAYERAQELRAAGALLAGWNRERIRVRPVARALERMLARPVHGSRDTDRQRQEAAKLLEYLEAENLHAEALEDRLTQLRRSTEHDQRALGTMMDSLLRDVKEMQLMPFASLLEVFPRYARDLARDQGKEVALIIHGGEIEVDRRILEQMKDPLTHMLRNCIDHGIEPPAVRAERRKPPQGTIALAVSQIDSGKVEITVEDDGGGIDTAKVKAAAGRLGLLSGEEAERLTEHEALALVFQSGISTSLIITDVSGRGLGLAIVREKVERLGGTVALDTRPGAGTTFRLRVPLSLATFRGVLVRVGERILVVPAASVERVLRVAVDGIRTVENRGTISVDGRPVALASLGDALELPPKAVTGAPAERVAVIVLAAAFARIAFRVDEVLGEQEVLVKGLGPQLARVRNVAGASVLGTGQVVPVLSASDLVKSAVRLASAPSRVAAVALPAAQQKKGTILVVEDSITSRGLLKNILEAAGYEVATAVDGIDAYTALKTAAFDLVVSDVEMPRMSGFGLTAKVRADKKLEELPVVLVTALDSREHRERGIDVGANAYIVKSSFDQSNLLEVVRRLI